jgi:patatin-like phospholipase/acyl hydrolase
MTYRVLSIDGGGMRGVAPAQMLCVLDAELKKAGKGSVADNFDLFVGTSTGCIIAAGLAASGSADQDLSPNAIKQLYYKRGKAMFRKTLWGFNPFGIFGGEYKQASKGRVLREVLGDLTLGDLKRNFLGIFYNIGAGPGPIFAHGGPSYGDSGEFNALKLWQVVNASSSPPIYFDPSKVEAGAFRARGVDGGLFANNPAMCAYVEARELSTDDILVASFGCGQQSIEYPHRRRWSSIEWISPWAGAPLIEAMFDGQTQSVSHEMKYVTQSWFRFEFSLDGLPPVALDDTRRQSLDEMVKAANAYLASDAGDAQMKALVSAL